MIIDKLAIKPLLITTGVLTLLLSISVFANVRQYRAGAIADTACAAQQQQAVDTGEIDALRRAAGQSQAIAEAAILERDRIAEDFMRIEAEKLQLQSEYERLLLAIPPLPAVCAPGQDRVDAFNWRG